MVHYFFQAALEETAEAAEQVVETVAAAAPNNDALIGQALEITLIGMVILFVSTTNPSEFAASLNRIGVNYKICYAVSLAVRYIPDIQREYHDISISLQARGVEMTKKEKFLKRLKNIVTILFPLIITSMARIETVSNAMELRSFGKNKKRTWYEARPFRPADIAVIVVCALLLVLSISLSFVNKGRFYNPFV